MRELSQLRLNQLIAPARKMSTNLKNVSNLMQKLDFKVLIKHCYRSFNRKD